MYSTITAEQEMQSVQFSVLAVGDFIYDETNGVCRKISADQLQNESGTITSNVSPTQLINPVNVNMVWNYA